MSSSLGDQIFDILVSQMDQFVNIFDVMRKLKCNDYELIRNACLDVPLTYDNVFIFNHYLTINPYGTLYPLVLIYTTKYSQNECLDLLNKRPVFSNTHTYSPNWLNSAKTTVNTDMMRWLPHAIDSDSFDPFSIVNNYDFVETVIIRKQKQLLVKLFNKYGRPIVTSNKNYDLLAIEYDNDDFLKFYYVHKIKYFEERISKLEEKGQYCVVL